MIAPPSINMLAKSMLRAQGERGASGIANAAKLTQTQVYVGLNDSETRRQTHETDHCVALLKRVCVSYGLPFSLDVVNGGYMHDDGEYTEENTIVLTFINVGQETIDEMARDLCSLFHQESVLVTTSPVVARSVRVAPEE